MTRHLAMEGRKHGVRANSLSPGVIETPSTIARSKDPEWAAAMTGRIMRGSLGKPEEIAAVALFLASDESSFVNAADIVVDGGITAWG
jgi:NAD(P)-dependent dehydrogenase (short-subunit alcohol dehydrogenase family)